MSAAAPQPVKILLVDDDEDLLKVYQLTLSKTGYEVDVAEGGYQALGKMDKTAYDIVVLDLMMPNCSGFEVLLKLQEKKGAKPSVIVATGAHKDADTVKRIRLEPIVADFLFKPLEADALIDAISRALKKD
ncbi:MAG: response regulator [Elusimicrobiota bacterium]